MWRRLRDILAVGAVLFLLASIFGPWAIQQWEIRAALAFQQRLNPIVSADPRFSHIKIQVNTAPNIVVTGTIHSEKAFQELKALCQPPPEAHFHTIMQVYPDYEIGPPFR